MNYAMLLILNIFFGFVQVVCCLFGIWCLLCYLLCCFGMLDWNCPLLLFALYYCYSLCCCRTGMPPFFKIINHDKKFQIFVGFLFVLIASFHETIGGCIRIGSQYTSKIQISNVKQWGNTWWGRGRINDSYGDQQWLLGEWTNTFTWGCSMFYRTHNLTFSLVLITSTRGSLIFYFSRCL